MVSFCSISCFSIVPSRILSASLAAAFFSAATTRTAIEGAGTCFSVCFQTAILMLACFLYDIICLKMYSYYPIQKAAFLSLFILPKREKARPISRRNIKKKAQTNAALFCMTRPISRVLSCAIIYLVCKSPHSSSRHYVIVHRADVKTKRTNRRCTE